MCYVLKGLTIGGFCSSCEELQHMPQLHVALRTTLQRLPAAPEYSHPWLGVWMVDLLCHTHECMAMSPCIYERCRILDSAGHISDAVYSMAWLHVCGRLALLKECQSSHEMDQEM